MSAEKSKLLDYIREKERKEKAQRRKKLMWISGGMLVIATLLAGKITANLMKSPPPLKTYQLSSLDMDKVDSIFEENTEAFVVVDSTGSRKDTIGDREDFVMLLTAIRDNQEVQDYTENTELASAEQHEFEPEMNIQPAASGKNKPKIDDREPLTIADIMPAFPGGETALYRFLSEKLRYPTLATQNQVEGKVYIRFVIEKDGSITDATVLKGIGYGCDEEALRVVNNMPPWTPGEVEGQKVRMFSSLAVNFKFL